MDSRMYKIHLINKEQGNEVEIRELNSLDELENHITNNYKDIQKNSLNIVLKYVSKLKKEINIDKNFKQVKNLFIKRVSKENNYMNKLKH